MMDDASLYIGHFDFHVRRKSPQLRCDGGQCWGIATGPVDGPENCPMAIMGPDEAVDTRDYGSGTSAGSRQGRWQLQGTKA